MVPLWQVTPPLILSLGELGRAERRHVWDKW